MPVIAPADHGECRRSREARAGVHDHVRILAVCNREPHFVHMMPQIVLVLKGSRDRRGNDVADPAAEKQEREDGRRN